MRFAWCLLAVLLLLPSFTPAADDEARRTPKQLRELVEQFCKVEVLFPKSPAFQEMLLIAQTGDDAERHDLLREIAKVVAADKTERSIVPFTLLGRLGFPRTDLTIVCCEHLFDRDADLQRLYVELLDELVGMHGLSVYRRKPDFGIIAEALTYPMPDSVKENTFRYMFQRCPSAAFDVLALHDRKVVKDRVDLLTEKDEAELALRKYRHDAWPEEPEYKANAEKALAKLAKREPWWCRLYVAESLARNRDFFKNIKQFAPLAKDEHPLVSEAMSEAGAKIRYRTSAQDERR